MLRANLPAAAASTLITNPVTFGPLYYVAYQLGSWVTSETSPPQEDAKTARMTEPDKNTLATNYLAGETSLGRIADHGQSVRVGNLCSHRHHMALAHRSALAW